VLYSNRPRPDRKSTAENSTRHTQLIPAEEPAELRGLMARARIAASAWRDHT
jgi:hypothetical protein